ncbi:MAG: hypothetical protein UIM53_03155 [Acutalibacteraceae bacterium]|nr:hypothetical protein [Acutalibacteraceae bacterium]
MNNKELEKILENHISIGYTELLDLIKKGPNLPPARQTVRLLFVLHLLTNFLTIFLPMLLLNLFLLLFHFHFYWMTVFIAPLMYAGIVEIWCGKVHMDPATFFVMTSLDSYEVKDKSKLTERQKQIIFSLCVGFMLVLEWFLRYDVFNLLMNNMIHFSNIIDIFQYFFRTLP